MALQPCFADRKIVADFSTYSLASRLASLYQSWELDPHFRASKTFIVSINPDCLGAKKIITQELV